MKSEKSDFPITKNCYCGKPYRVFSVNKRRGIFRVKCSKCSNVMVLKISDKPKLQDNIDNMLGKMFDVSSIAKALGS